MAIGQRHMFTLCIVHQASLSVSYVFILSKIYFWSCFPWNKNYAVILVISQLSFPLLPCPPFIPSQQPLNLSNLLNLAGEDLESIRFLRVKTSGVVKEERPSFVLLKEKGSTMILSLILLGLPAGSLACMKFKTSHSKCYLLSLQTVRRLGDKSACYEGDKI